MTISFTNIHPQDLFHVMTQPKVMVIDVRNENELITGKIPHAVHIPLAMLPLECDKLQSANRVVFYCHSGVRSALAAEFAASKGISQVAHLEGGVIAWAHAGYTFVEHKTEHK